MVDKRRKLYKTIKKNGIIIDCSVPKGDRKADKIAQEAVLAERMEALLGRYGKVMDKKTYRAVYELTGFDIDTFCDNLEKLIDYVGDEKEITAKDVAFVLKRTRKDPIYELTNAVAERNVGQSFFFLNSLLLENFHPLQILASITNQIRKLLVIKDFAESSHGSSWYPEMPYAQFANRVMTAIQSYNKELLDQIEQWNDMLSADMNGDAGKTNKRLEKKKLRPVTDLEIANNPYPVYKLMLNSEKFNKKELVEALEHLSQADLRLKYTKQKPKTVLEEVIFRICKETGKGES
jgi:DNA polymerase-3 subunit delta